MVKSHPIDQISSVNDVRSLLMDTVGSNHPEIEWIQAGEPKFKVPSARITVCVISAFLNEHFSVYPLLPVAKMLRIIWLK